MTSHISVHRSQYISEADPDISIRGEKFGFQNNLIQEKSKGTEAQFKVKITKPDK